METLNNTVISSNGNLSSVMPNDLVMSILSKLPVKSLKRFTCVNKSWEKLLEDPHFMRLFRENLLSKLDDSSVLLLQDEPGNSKDKNLFLLSGQSYENKIKLDWPAPFEDHGNIYSLGTCINGIICLTDLNQGGKVVLWNPTTEEYKLIPPGVPDYFGIDFCIDFTAFGYDDVTDDYKVMQEVNGFVDTFLWSESEVSTVQLASEYPDQDVLNKGIWQIYSLKSNSWRKLDINISSIACERNKPSVYLNGVCHWLSYINYYEEFELQLQSFDMRDETIKTTSIYQCNNVDFVFGKLVVLNGLVAWIKEVVENNYFDISILGEVGVKESWVKIFSIGQLSCVYRPLGIGNKGNIFFQKDDGELAWFDLRTQMMQDIGMKVTHCCQTMIYKESFLFIGGSNE